MTSPFKREFGSAPPTLIHNGTVYVTIAEAAKRANASQDVIRRAIRTETLPSVLHPRVYGYRQPRLIAEAALAEWAETRKAAA